MVSIASLAVFLKDPKCVFHTGPQITSHESFGSDLLNWKSYVEALNHKCHVLVHGKACTLLGEPSPGSLKMPSNSVQSIVQLLPHPILPTQG